MEKLINQGVRVDLTITSPPYDDLRSYNGNNENWNENTWKKIIMKLHEITIDGGVVVWVVADRTSKGSESGTSFKQALFFMENAGFNLNDTMIYKKNGGLPIKTYRYNNEFEYMFIFSKGKPKTFNPLKIPCRQAGKIASGTQREKNGNVRQKSENGKQINEFRTKGNVWEYEVGYNKTTKDKEAYKHPAMFPEKLAKDHILSWSNPGDLVFDCFMGSGTTGKMAKELKRNYIGIEIDDSYFELAKRRIENYVVQLEF